MDCMLRQFRLTFPPSSMAVSYTAPVVCLVRRWTVVWPKVWWRNRQTCRFVETWQVWRNPRTTFSWTKCTSSPLCFVRLWKTGSFVNRIELLISQSSVGDFSNCKPISCKMCLIQVSSIAVVAIERLLVLDQDTVCCFLGTLWNAIATKIDTKSSCASSSSWTTCPIRVRKSIKIESTLRSLPEFVIYNSFEVSKEMLDCPKISFGGPWKLWEVDATLVCGINWFGIV